MDARWQRRCTGATARLTVPLASLRGTRGDERPPMILPAPPIADCTLKSFAMRVARTRLAYLRPCTALQCFTHRTLRATLKRIGLATETPSLPIEQVLGKRRLSASFPSITDCRRGPTKCALSAVAHDARRVARFRSTQSRGEAANKFDRSRPLNGDELRRLVHLRGAPFRDGIDRRAHAPSTASCGFVGAVLIRAQRGWLRLGQPASFRIGLTIRSSTSRVRGNPSRFCSAGQLRSARLCGNCERASGRGARRFRLRMAARYVIRPRA